MQGAGLNSQILAQIQSYLTNAGGSAPFGKVTQQFKGIKKADLQVHFFFTEGQNPIMSLPEAGMRLPQATGMNSCSGDIPTQISSYLTDVGGSAPFGSITRKFPGTKKADLEEHFIFSEGQNPTISLPQVGMPPPMKKTRVSTSTPRRKKGSGGSLDVATVEAISTYLQQNGGSAMMGNLSQEFRGVKSAQLNEHFNVTTEGSHQVRVSLW